MSEGVGSDIATSVHERYENPRDRDVTIPQDDATMSDNDATVLQDEAAIPQDDSEVTSRDAAVTGDSVNKITDLSTALSGLCHTLGEHGGTGKGTVDDSCVGIRQSALQSAINSAVESDEDVCVETTPLASQSDILRTDLTKPLPPMRGTSFSGEEEDLNPDEDSRGSCDPRIDFLSACHKAADQAEELVHRVWEAGWRVVHHRTLPKWLKDNDFLLMGHRPPTYSFLECFKSIFRIHTETGNIWTHLLGFVAFVAITLYFLTRPSIEIQIQEKAVFSPFFFGAILCLGFSTLFHTLYCHSEKVGKLFNKLDYCGISLLTMGSFVPWLYYSFYCRLKPKITYLVLIFVLGTCSIVVSLWDKFSTPQYRVLRAGVFIALGLSGIIPALHYVITDGFYHAITFASLGWLLLMAVLYIAGAIIYAARIPERLFPGKFDIWFQSHQIFHVFVVAAAFVHYHGISRIATYRLTGGDCIDTDLQ